MSVEQAAREYIRLRRLKIDLKDHRNGLHLECAVHETGEYNPSYCCVFTTTKRDEEGNEIPDPDEWCEHCKESEVAHQWFLLASRKAAIALRKLEREVQKTS